MSVYYRVRVRQENFEVEVESSERAYIDEKLEAYGVSPIPSRATRRLDAAAPSQTGPKPTSIQEFARQVGPTKDVEYVATATYFCEKYEEMEEVKAKDVTERFSKIKYKHSNHSVAIARAKEKGWLMDRGAGFVVTNTGERWVEERLKGNPPQE